MKFPRSFYIPEGAQAETVAAADAVVYRYENDTGIPFALAFYGKAQKPAFHHRFRSVEQRERCIDEYIQGRTRSLSVKAERHAERVNKPRTLKVGDVLRCSWGYDQTNIDYYEVTALVGSKCVEITPIAQESIETAYMQGNCIPVPGKYIGAPMRKRPSGDAIRMNSYSSAFKCEPTVIHGAKVYSSSHWTAYA